MKISLKYRIAIVFFILAGLMMAVVLSVTLSRSYDVNRRHLEVNENVILKQVVDLCRIALFTSQYDDLQPYLEQATQDPHIVKVSMANRSGIITVSSDVMDIGREFDVTEYKPDQFWHIESIENSSGRLGTLAIQFSHEQLQQANQEALSLGIKTAIVGIIIIAIGGILMGHLLTRRLDVLSRVAADIASGDLDARTGLTGTDEVALVGSTFDRMAQSISEYVEYLQKSEARLLEAQADLENRVMQRTEELAIARDEALEASKTKSSFLASMSHELRTPLNAIIGYSELLLEDAKRAAQKDLEVDLEKINSAGMHLLSLVNDVLDLSKIEAGKMSLVLGSFGVKECIEDMLKSLYPLVHKNKCSIKLNYEDEVGSIYADKIKFRQVLINLISNAAKFAPGSEIKVSCSLKSDDNNKQFLIVSVSDSGPGISESKLGRIFDEFSQLSSVESSLQKGTGLGLAISQKYCQRMGGEISVESKKGVGSTFIVRLPTRVPRAKVA